MKKNILTIIFLFSILNTFSQKGPGGVDENNGASTLSWWLKADHDVYKNAGTILAQTGESVYQWNDQSGYSRHIQQSTPGNRPTYTTGILNGNPVIRFKGSSKNHLGYRTVDAFDGNYSIFIVGYSTSNSHWDQTIMSAVFSNTKTHGILLEADQNNSLRFLHRFPLDDSGGNNLIKGGTRSLSTSQVLSFTRGTPPNGAQQFWINGADNQSITASNGTFSSAEPGRIGLGRLGEIQDSRYLNGDIAEVIIVSKEVNKAEKIIIENYLAAKYGITLGESDVYSQDDPGNGNFDHEVAGIGRISATEYHNSAQGSGIVRVSNPTDLDNNDFLMWGHDNGIAQAVEITDVPSGIEARFNRVWRVSEVNNKTLTVVNVGAIDISFDLTGLGSVTASDLRLLVDTDNDGVFSDETPISGASSLGGNVYQFSGVTEIKNNLRFTLGTINVSQTPLPIELLSFNATLTNNRTVNLEWQTASEVNNDYFTVERSENGIEWKELQEIKGAGNSSSLLIYSSIDSSPLQETSYYRLKQTDFNGESSYSKIKSINNNKLLEDVIVYPNPSISEIIIEGDQSEIDRVRLYTILGQDITYLTQQDFKSKTKLVINTSNLGSGLYYVKTRNTVCKIYKK